MANVNSTNRAMPISSPSTVVDAARQTTGKGYWRVGDVSTGMSEHEGLAKQFAGDPKDIAELGRFGLEWLNPR